LDGLLQDDVLETIAKFNVASSAIDNLMPFVVEDEEEVVLNANRIVYSLETNLAHLVQEFYFQIVKQTITDSGALDGGIVAFVTRDDTDLIYGTMDMVLEYVLQAQNIITAKKRSFTDLGAIVLYGALRLKAQDAGDFIQHINDCVKELGLRGTWDFAKGTGTYPGSWLAESSDVLIPIASDCPYFDDHEYILYHSGPSDKHGLLYNGDLDYNDVESAVYNGDFEGPIGHWADAAEAKLKQVNASDDWEDDTVAENGNSEGQSGHWADPSNSHATGANDWEYAAATNVQDFVEDYSHNYLQGWDEGDTQHGIADWNAGYTKNTGTWDSAVGANFDDAGNEIVETAWSKDNDAAIDWNFDSGPAYWPMNLESAAFDAADYIDWNFAVDLTPAHYLNRRAKNKYVDVGTEEMDEAAASNADDYIDWNFAVDFTPAHYLNRRAKNKYVDVGTEEMDEAADVTWDDANNPLDAEHDEVSWDITAASDWNDEGYHSVVDWNETSYKKNDAWDDHFGGPLTTTEEETPVHGIWTITEAAVDSPGLEDDTVDQDAAWNNHTDVRDITWKEEEPQQTEITWNNAANDGQTSLWQDKPALSWDNHVTVAGVKDVEAFPAVNDQYTRRWADCSNDIATAAAQSWNEDDESYNNELPSWTDTVKDSSPIAASTSWSEDTVQGEEWNFKKDKFSSKLTYHDDTFDATYRDDEFDAVKYAHWNEVPASQSMYVRAY